MTIPTPSSDQIFAPRARVLSGMRPTGRLHLGNYMGALYNWVQLQHQYECFFFIADYHALTTDYADPSRLKQNVYDIALDFLAAGLDPDQCTLFIQSHVLQHAELNLIFSMITPLSWLERVPTYKDQQEQLREKDLATYGFLGYPLLQSADILLYKPDFVPVGQDQVAHVEITREIARRFNFLYDKSGIEGDPILPDPQALLTPSPKLPGIDGRKMSKSYGNTILMTDPESVVLEKTQSMSNGGQRPTQHDPGDPEICPVGDLHRVFSTLEIDAHIRVGCTTAAIRCDECKALLGTSIAGHTVPMLNRRAQFASDPDEVWRILDNGAARAAARAERTMRDIRAVTGLSRDRSGVRAAASADSQPNLHDLTAHKDWWFLDPTFLLKELRDHWLKAIVPSDVALKHGDDGVMLTQNQRRVFLAASTQQPGEACWSFSVKPKSYEIIVLLCWNATFHLHDFVIPQKLYVAPWTAAKKAAGKGTLDFTVIREAGRFVLHLPLADPSGIDITETEAGYKILGL